LTAAFAFEWSAVGIRSRKVWFGKFSHWFLVRVKAIGDLRFEELTEQFWDFEIEELVGDEASI
jgi:hypothetical protein